MCLWVLMELELILTELRPLNLVILGNFCIVGYCDCVINSSHSFLWIFLKPCILVVDIMKTFMWVFDGARVNFDRITAFELSNFRICIVGYCVCKINSSYSLL